MITLSPLNALRAFEAAARLGSFTRAAAELGVTSAAVGQQVRGLEARIGAPLFHRALDGLTPTARARAALPKIRRGFDFLAQGFQSLTPAADQAHVVISAAPTFAMKWLVPRLHRFHERHPTIDLSFDTAMGYVNVGRGEADLAIRFGAGRYPGLRSERLFQEWVLPLCAPSLGLGDRNSSGPIDLEGVELIHMEGETADRTWLTWQGWAEANGLASDRPAEGPRFSQSAVALQAAIEGQGVALCGITYALEDMVAGKLYAPFGTGCAFETRYGYDMVYSPARADHPGVRAFRNWMTGEAQRSRAQIAEIMARHDADLGKRIVENGGSDL